MNRFRLTCIVKAVVLVLFLVASVAESHAQWPHRVRRGTARAGVNQGFHDVIPELARKARIPVRLPRSPALFSTRHARAEVLIEKADTYVYRIAVKKWGCREGYYYCLLGFVKGEASTPNNRKAHASGRKVKLAKGIWGWFQTPARSVDLPTLHWEQDDVVYSLGVDGSRATAIRIANGMVSSQPINRQ